MKVFNFPDCFFTNCKISFTVAHAPIINVIAANPPLTPTENPDMIKARPNDIPAIFSHMIAGFFLFSVLVSILIN